MFPNVKLTHICYNKTCLHDPKPFRQITTSANTRGIIKRHQNSPKKGSTRKRSLEHCNSGTFASPRHIFMIRLTYLARKAYGKRCDHAHVVPNNAKTWRENTWEINDWTTGPKYILEKQISTWFPGLVRGALGISDFGFQNSECQTINVHEVSLCLISL